MLLSAAGHRGQLEARTSLDALKISIRQLRWKEVRPARPAWAGGGLERPQRSLLAQARSQGQAPLSCATLVNL